MAVPLFGSVFGNNTQIRHKKYFELNRMCSISVYISETGFHREGKVVMIWIALRSYWK